MQTAKTIFIADILSGLREYFDISENMLAQKLGISRGAIRGLTGGDHLIVKEPKHATLKAISDLLKDLHAKRRPLMIDGREIVFSVDELRDMHLKHAPPKPPEQHVVEIMRKLTDKNKQKIIQLAEVLMQEEANSEPIGRRKGKPKLNEERAKLTRNFDQSGVFGLLALIDLYLQELGVDLAVESADENRDKGFEMLARQMSTDSAKQQEYLEMLRTLKAKKVLPTNFVPFLTHLSRLLKDRKGKPFKGDSTAMLICCGLLR